jgi:hypothetical protein
MSKGTLLISETKLKNFTNINRNVDMDLLKSSISDAQDLDLQPILGTRFYDHLLAQVNLTGNTFNADEKILVDDYISKYIIEAAYFHALPNIQFRVMNRAVVQGDAENASHVDIETFKYLRSIQKQKSDFYLMRLQDYLITGRGQNKFPEYQTQSTLDGMISNKQAGYMSALYLPGASRKGFDLTQMRNMGFGGNTPAYSEYANAWFNCPDCW